MFRKTRYLYAVCDGMASELSEIPDEAFSSGMLGVGYSIQPRDGTFYSPVSGKAGNIAASGHAYTFTTKDGVDVLVHIGIDTVELKGDGFEPLVKAGQNVNAGDVIARVDLSKIRNAGLNTVSAVLITNPEMIDGIEYDLGNVRAKDDAVLSYKIRKG